MIAKSSTEIVRARPVGGLSPRTEEILSRRLEELTPQSLVDLWLAELRSDHSRRAYTGDLEHFRAWLGAVDAAQATAVLVASDQGAVNRLGIAFQTSLREAGLSPGTVNRKLAALKSLLKMARRLGLTVTTLEVRRLAHQSYRDTSGPPREVLGEMFKALEEGKAVGRFAKGKGRYGKGGPRIIHLRNLALARLMYFHGLRVGEVTGLDLRHYDRTTKSVSIMGKGRLEREVIKLSPKAAAAMEAWIAARGNEPGPMFPTVTPGAASINRPMVRLDRSNIGRALKTLGIRNPHALRHAAITRLLELNGGDLSAGMAFSRHKSATVLMLYRDNAAKLGEKAAALLDGDL